MRLDKEKSYLKREIKFFKKHLELIDKYAVVLKKLADDPFEPSLKLHKLQGSFREVSCGSFDLRIPDCVGLDDRR